MKICIGADHGGFKLKEMIINSYLDSEMEVTDMGSKEYMPKDDYPDIAIKVANAVSNSEYDRGILICRNGVGMCITANKVSGIRAVNTENVDVAVTSRNDDNTNILCLGADYISLESALRIIESWLNKPFSSEIRHINRINKIREYELSSN